VVPVDLGSNSGFLGYEGASEALADAALYLAKRHGRPTSVVGLYEHVSLPAARLRSLFGTSGTPENVAVIFRDKILMKSMVAKAGVLVPRNWNLASAYDVASAAIGLRTLQGQVVIKPRSGAAADGVSVFENAEAALAAIPASGMSGYQVEEFINGQVGHADGVVRAGVLCSLSVSFYHGNCHNFRSAGGPLGSAISDDEGIVKTVFEWTSEVLAALGLRDDVFHLEFFLTDHGQVVFLEVANRVGGAWVWKHLKEIYGLDLIEEAHLACRAEPAASSDTCRIINSENHGSSGWFFLGSSVAGRISGWTGLDRLPDDVRCAELAMVGTTPAPESETFYSPGRFLVAGKSRVAVIQAFETIESTVQPIYG